MELTDRAVGTASPDVVREPSVTSKLCPHTALSHSRDIASGPTTVEQGRFQKKIKGSSFVGMAATPLKALPSCYRVKRTNYRVLDIHVKFAKQSTHYLILFQELESNKKNLSSEKG